MSVSTWKEVDEVVDYRVVSKAAVFSLTLGLLSIVAFLGVGTLILPSIGLVCGVIALRAIARFPEELSGRTAAWIGIVLSLFFLVTAGFSHAYEYTTEVPEGFERLPFYALRPDPEIPGQLVPADIMKLDGKKVFLKGYVHPSVEKKGAVRQFMLVGDMKQCCFGGTPKVTEFVDVNINGNDQVRYSWRLRKLAGVLHVDPSKAPFNGVAGPCYRLDAEYVK